MFSFFGFLSRFLGFLIAGYGIGRFVLDNYKMSEWQVRIALALGFFGLLVSAFALGSGIALTYGLFPRRTAGEEPGKTAG